MQSPRYSNLSARSASLRNGEPCPKPSALQPRVVLGPCDCNFQRTRNDVDTRVRPTGAAPSSTYVEGAGVLMNALSDQNVALMA